ncbi:MAG: alpha,alpha-trehalose-phosphate synthase (UDP-forming) [Terriglobales bacterium]
MRLSLRPILWLVASVILITFALAYLEVRDEEHRLLDELERNIAAAAERMQGDLPAQPTAGSRDEPQRLAVRLAKSEHVSGLALFDRQGTPLAVTPGVATRLAAPLASLVKAKAESQGGGDFLWLDQLPVYVYVLPGQAAGRAGVLVVVQDASYIDSQKTRIWRDASFRVLLRVLLIALTALLAIRWSIAEPIKQTAQWMRALRTGRVPKQLALPDKTLLQPLANEVASFARSLEAARDAAAKEARLREAADSQWTAERLSAHVQKKLQGNRLMVVSNREPYMHRRSIKGVETIVPASGLVTALEPILRASEGTWIAHGSGDADRETADERGRLRVPLEDPQYTLRRVWLSKEEEQGYYFGFANEGLWPLCHIAHTRPVFRAADWEQYQAVNRRFAEAVVEEMADAKQPFLLVQDYHFALLPRLVKKLLPQARVAIFWHIPWPNPEAFGICPWQRELLDGMLGADLLGFHIQEHCNNFLETVDRALESRISWERFSVKREGHTSVVLPFPISVDFPETVALPSDVFAAERAAVLAELGNNGATRLGVGVDRVDYTKGILERFRGLERFFEKYPVYLGQFTFVQIGAPSRTEIKRYHDLFDEVASEAERINARFQSGKWKPIVLRKRHHSHQEIGRFYRAADVCLVTSLHDGMNLVAKEFLAARQDEKGVLILSRFTGAARELRDALVVNPYDTEKLAEAIRFSLEMDTPEKTARMQRMRRVVKEYNIYRWAANLISELAELRIEPPENPKTHLRSGSGMGGM